MKKVIMSVLFLILSISETLMLFIFSVLPSITFIRMGLRSGDIEHLFAYFIYGFILFKTFEGFGTGKRKSLLLSLIIGSSVGLLCEFVQYTLPYRTGDAIDWFIDTASCLLGSRLAYRNKILKHFKITNKRKYA